MAWRRHTQRPEKSVRSRSSSATPTRCVITYGTFSGAWRHPSRPAELCGGYSSLPARARSREVADPSTLTVDQRLFSQASDPTAPRFPEEEVQRTWWQPCRCRWDPIESSRIGCRPRFGPEFRSSRGKGPKPGFLYLPFQGKFARDPGGAVRPREYNLAIWRNRAFATVRDGTSRTGSRLFSCRGCTYSHSDLTNVGGRP
jgi:hypothetical protein